ncbi:hypothetical protein [Bradyrhizobium sp. STM 3561]|uniref:hypothetical protein n=1 Tax=Bradyrhizobium sp. STM 3561 TaxID=578923 RepID=UPI00388D109C
MMGTVASMDATSGETDHVAGEGIAANSNRSVAWVFVARLVLCTVCIPASAKYANAQCSARDELLLQLTHKTMPTVPRSTVTSVSDVARWKTITIGTFPDVSALLTALAGIGCGVGESAAAVVALPAFSVSAVRNVVALLTVSAAELGFKCETASLRQIYERAQQLGFELAPPEIAPQLRLQYLDQPVGEFLIVGMKPIRTSTGHETILTVANGGAGLILIGQDGRADAEIPVGSRFVFVRSLPTTPAASFDRDAPG